MNHYDIKFTFDLKNYNYSIIRDVLKKAEGILNWRFDGSFNATLIDDEIDYQVTDVSKWETIEIEKTIDSFFSFTFENTVDAALYKFLVLKNNEQIMLLANISSLIFDYSSIEDFYELFNDLDKSSPEHDLYSHYKEVSDYLNSSNFEKDSKYWKNYILDSSGYINFYNLKNDTYKKQTINVDRNSVLAFCKTNGCSLFDFYASAFSLYLSRVNRIDGCLLKTIIPHEKSNFGALDKNTFLKVDVRWHDSFKDLLNGFDSSFMNSLNHTRVNVDDYLDENISYYSIYSFNNSNENISVYNGNDSALTLNIYENSLELIYNSDLFSDVYAIHMAKNIESLINDVLDSPDKQICDIDILSSEEKALLSDFCKGKTVEVEKDRMFSESVRQHAKDNPNALAVDDGVNRITYGEIEKSSNSIARDLYENHNIGPGSRVALMLHRDYHFPEFVLALNKIGAAFVPIDLLFPANRIEHMLKIGGVKHLITTRAIAQNLDLSANIITIEDLNYDDEVDVEILSKNDDLLAILFTSGTTGIPKGVMFHNRQFPWFGAAFTDMFDFTYGDVVGCYFSFSFVASLVIFASLYLGGAVRLFNENEQKNSLLLIKALKENHMNSLILPPSIGIPIFENEDLNLDYLILAGAKLNELSKMDRHTKLVNFYGTTEVLFAISKIYDLNDIEDNRVPIGRPVANTWTYILDENGNQMPIGVPGEICISSAGITQGYWNDSQTTAEVYVDNPFCDSEINKRMYCTGDIGFYNFDGEIEIIGREDEQLSVRGFRVESKEILTIMKSFKEISDIYLDVDNDNLIAYYTTSEDLNINEVKDSLTAELPYYMIPSLFLELEKIPLNINGKIDKTALKVVANDEDVEITDDVISSVVDAFKEVLNQDSVSVDDDFVALGGNSLSAMKLQLLLKEKFNVYISSNELINLSTPNDIANHIKFNSNSQTSIDEEKYSFDEPCPMSESQLNVYLDESVNNNGTGYNNPFRIDFKDNYSVDEIKRALNKLFEIFPILKARVLNNDGELSFAFDAEPKISEGHLNDINTFVREFELDRYLSRFLIVEYNDSIILCADFHHLIFDGTSLNILLNGLNLILNGESVDFVDNGSLRQKSFEEIIDSEYMDDAREFFEVMLADRYEAADLLECVDGDDDEWELVDTFDIDDEHLNSFLQNHSITYNQFFTGVFGYTLSRFSGSDKVIFNMVGDGRGHIDLSQSIGMFVKTLPLLMDCKNQNINSYLEYSSNLVNSVMKYDMYPFRVLAHEYDLNSNIVFQYSHDLFSNVINKKDLNYDINELQHDLTADLSFNIFNTGKGRLTIRILYSSRYSRSFIKHFAESYRFILNEMLNVGELKDINYTSDSDIELLDSYNQNESPLDYEDILEAFNDNLAKYPDNKLVCYNDKTYTYAESAFIADKIAERLKEIGVEKNDNVSFLVNRSEEYLLSILGIISIGAVYVPLDDEHPDDRIQFILKDTESKAIIVSDETYERAENLADGLAILNISDIIKKDNGTLSSLPVISSRLICILYTSGTTGIPKGVKITRKSIVNYIEYYVKKSGISHNDVFALYASIGFDVGAIKSIFVPMYCGACLDIIPKDVRMDMNKLNNHFNNRNVSHAHLPTQVAKLFINGTDNHSLDVLCTGGEKLGEIDYSCDYVFVDSYGPTEACVSVTAIEEKDKIDSSSIGYLLDNINAYILDDEFRRVPVGAVGELYLSGIQLADGYLNHDEETRKAFLNNPFDDEEGYNVMYRTGDMVRILPDGSIGIVGRRDSQVKIRGNRVELSEIVSDIQEIEFVEDVTLQTIKHGSNNELVAYVVVNNDLDDNDVGDLICEHVRKHKPEYMVPSFVMKLDSIPLTVNDKVDKSALPDVDIGSLKTEYVAPTNETERAIIDAFELVFNQKDIGLNDDFVRLGGDSITAIRVISLLEKSDLSCSARDILNYKTPYLIAQNVEKITKTSYDATEGEVELLPIQSYFFDQIKNNEFSQDFILKSTVKLDLDILQKAFDELTNIHDMLRATYRYDEDKVIQEILPLNSHVCEIKEYTVDNLNDAFEDILKESKQSLNIENELIKISVIHYADECYVIFTIHHLIIDGVSWSSLLDDLTYIYNQMENNKEINVLRPYPYKSWVENVKSLAENISEDEKQHWIKVNSMLDDSTIKGRFKGFAFNVDATFDINNLLMLSEDEYLALSIARAYKKTYGKEVIFNNESYGRDDSLADVNRTVGWFTTHFPVVVDVKNEYDPISLMNDVYSIKDAFNDVEHLGLNYGSLIYTSHELEYKHCPITFNFLSSEFSFKNELFESVNQYVPSNDEIELFDLDRETFGITFNVTHHGNSYYIIGDYADNTYIGNEFNTFIENIKSELDFIGNFDFKDNNIVCCLSEPQLGIYLDEKVNDRGQAYSRLNRFECNSKYSFEEIKEAINALINKHPILRSRILDTDRIPLLICDEYPPIEIVENKEQYSNLINPFDLNKHMASFAIEDNEIGKIVYYRIHHIIADAISYTIINKELEQALMGSLDDSIDLGFVYSSNDSFEFKYDYKYKSAQKFFQDEFADIDDVQHILSDIDGSKGSVSLPIRGIREKVELFTHQNGITVSNLLNAVFAYTYSRFTASDKVHYNFIEHGRHENYEQNAIGMFARTIPVIVDCENKPVRDFVAYMSDLILKSMDNSIYPFRLLSKEFNLSNAVLFEYNYDLNDFKIGNDMIVTDEVNDVSDFVCTVNDLKDGFLVSLSHLDKFSQDTAKQFVKTFEKILIQFLEKENLKDIDYISNEDVEILDSYNQTQCQFEYNDVLDAFNDNLSEYENNILVGYKDNKYTHGQAAFIANEIADRLINSGAAKQDYIALFVNRSEWFLLASLGVLSMGGIYVPIDTTYPDERIILMLEDTASKLVIVDDNSEQNIKRIILENDLGIDVLNVSDITTGEIPTSNHLNTVEVNENDIACVLYTSGTTGVPKGVLITRKAINNFISWYVKETDFTSNDIYGMHCSYVFDMHTAPLYSPIITGGALYIVPEDIRHDLKALNNYYVEHGCTHTYITSQVGKLFAESGMETTIKLLCFGGMKLGELNAPDSIGPFESYGPSENLAISTSIFANKRVHHSSIGRFLSNVKGYVLDSDLRRVPLGAVGELYLAGAQLTPGYLNRPEENAKAFFDNPFDDEEGYELIYATGDIVRFLPDGTLGIIGRRDSQVKIRGNRVELSEVESAIRSLDNIEDVTVQITPNNGNNELIAYVVLSEYFESSDLVDYVREYVSNHKPEYMVPSYVMELDEIPLNVNGKVDKRALPDIDKSSLHVEYVAPRNEKEKEIVEAFEKALNLDGIGIYDDFIRLGGDSLSAIKLLSNIETNDVTMADIFTFRTPEAIARNMSDFSFDLDLYSLERGCPLNEAQINVFADVVIYNKRNAYHIPGYIAISKEHALEDILDSLNRLIDAHPILGMRLSNRYEVNENSNISNLDLINDLITTAKKFGIKEIMSLANAYGLKDVKGLYNMLRTTIRLFKGEFPYLVKGSKPPISTAPYDENLIKEFFAESLDLYNNMSKFMIVETENSYYLIYLIHHIIFDATSAGVFKKDFQILLDGGDVELDETFLKSSAFTHQMKNTEKFDEADEYYKLILSDIDDVGILVGDNSSKGYSMSTYDLEFDKAAFKSFLNNAGITENVLFTSVFSYALSQFVDGERVIFTQIENGRDRFSEDFIGMTSNVMPLVADCKNQSIRSFIGNMTDVVYGASRYSYYPILLLYQRYNFEVNILFQYMPNWIADEFEDITDIEGIASKELINDVLNSYSDYLTEFFVQVFQNGDEYKLQISNSNRYSNEMVNNFKDIFMSILSNIINADMSSDLNSTLK